MKRFARFSSRLKGSALLISIVLSSMFMVVILVLTSLFDRQNFLMSRYDDMRQAQAAVTATMLMYCKDSMLFSENTDTTSFVPFDDINLRTFLERKRYGLYEKLTVTAHVSPACIYSVSYLLGNSVIPYDAGLYVPDNDMFLSIAGDCFFDNPIYIPDKGFRKTGDYVLTTQAIHNSDSSIPETDIVSCSEIFPADFPDSAVLTIRDSVPDKIVCADYICVDSSFDNSVQLFAKDSILVRKGAQMNYPSGLCVCSEEGRIVLEDSSSVNGYVFLISSEKHFDIKKQGGDILTPDFVMGKGAVIRGLLYVDGTAFLNSMISGGVYISCPMSKTRNGYSLMSLSSIIQTKNPAMAYPVCMKNLKYGKRLIKVMPNENHDIKK